MPGETASEAIKYVPALPGRYKSTHPLPQLRSSSIGAPATAQTACQAVPQKYVVDLGKMLLNHGIQTPQKLLRWKLAGS